MRGSRSGILSKFRHGLRCSIDPGPQPHVGRKGVTLHGTNLALTLYDIVILKAKEGTPERQRLASSYLWYCFPGLSHLSRLEAGC
jgi:hypothetical protein